MKKIGVYTKNFSLYHDLLKVLNNKNIQYISLSSKKNIPSKVGVILTSHIEIHDIKFNKIIAADVINKINS